MRIALALATIFIQCPDGLGPSPATDTSADTSTTDTSTTASIPTTSDTGEPTVFCGDGVRNGFEDCDGEDLGGLTCVDFGHTGGVLTCAADCSYSISQCTVEECGAGAACTSDEDCGEGLFCPTEEDNFFGLVGVCAARCAVGCCANGSWCDVADLKGVCLLGPPTDMGCGPADTNCDHSNRPLGCPAVPACEF